MCLRPPPQEECLIRTSCRELLHQRQKQRTLRQIVHTIWMFQGSFFAYGVSHTSTRLFSTYCGERQGFLLISGKKKAKFFVFFYLNAHLTWRSIMALPITFPHKTCAPVDTALSTHLHTISVRHDKWADCSPLGHRLFPWTCTCGHDNNDSSTETFLSVWKDDTLGQSTHNRYLRKWLASPLPATEQIWITQRDRGCWNKTCRYIALQILVQV